jgi:hypothetical protein
VESDISIHHHHHQEKVMTDIEPAVSPGKAARLQAEKEINDENLAKAVAILKEKYRERQEATTVLANVNREIDELELAVDQGNI